MRTAYTAHGMRSVGERFREAVSALPSPLREGLLQTAESLQETILEVRIWTGRPIQLKKMTGSLFCDKNGRRISCGEKAPTVSREDTELCFRSLCGYSVHSHRDELVNGFITVKGGHRAGICGTAVRENERITGVREITSINLRIAGEVRGCADRLAEIVEQSTLGVIVAGPPCSGKTTLLRELARTLSSGERGSYTTVAMVDERGELAAVWEGIPQNEIGISCDVLDGYPKAEGMLIALRTLSPEVLVLDEIGSDEEAAAVIAALHTGVKVVTTAHAGSLRELYARRQTAGLIGSGAFDCAVLLEAGVPGRIRTVYPLKQEREEGDRRWISG